MKKISKEKYLQALGLFHMASFHQKKWSEFESALRNLFGVERLDWLEEETFEDRPQFNSALKKDGYEVPKEFTH